jgi:hypothetical protein
MGIEHQLDFSLMLYPCRFLGIDIAVFHFILLYPAIPQLQDGSSIGFSKASVVKFDVLEHIINLQKMAETPQSIKQTASTVESLNIPSVFSVMLQGETEASSFSALSATLEIQPSPPGDPNPFLITCYMNAKEDKELVNGSLFWQSYSAEHPRRDEQYSRIIVTGNRVQMEVSPSNGLRSDVMWFTTSMGILPADIAGETRQMSRIGVMGMSGTLTFSIQENQISGEIQISGMSDLDTPSTYKATFVGNRISP